MPEETQDARRPAVTLVAAARCWDSGNDGHNDDLDIGAHTMKEVPQDTN
jgi:hypothetical protein